MATQYTYYPAATERIPDKPGVNRITWEDNGYPDQGKWTEVTREYFPADPRSQQSSVAMKAFMEASEEEKRIIANELKKYL